MAIKGQRRARKVPFYEPATTPWGVYCTRLTRVALKHLAGLARPTHVEGGEDDLGREISSRLSSSAFTSLSQEKISSFAKRVSFPLRSPERPFDLSESFKWPPRAGGGTARRRTTSTTTRAKTDFKG